MSNLAAGPWLLPPSAPDRLAFQMWVIDTGYPERFRGVCVDAKPPTDGTAIFVCGFYADPRKRDGERVPCSICSLEHPKFYEGGLIWAPAGRLYLVGHQCAARHFGAERYESMRADTRTATRLDQADFFLIANYKASDEIRAYIGDLRTAGQAFLHRRRQLWRGVPLLARAIVQSARDHNGMMALRTEASSIANALNLSRTARSMSATDSFATFSGIDFVDDDRFDPLRELDAVGVGLPPSRLSREAMEAYVRGLPVPRRFELAKNIRRAPRRLRALEAKLRTATEFFSRGHMKRLAEWGQHPQTVLQFDIVDCGNHSVEISGVSWEQVTLSTRPIEIPACQLPDLAEHRS